MGLGNGHKTHLPLELRLAIDSEVKTGGVAKKKKGAKGRVKQVARRLNIQKWSGFEKIVGGKWLGNLLCFEQGKLKKKKRREGAASEPMTKTKIKKREAA